MRSDEGPFYQILTSGEGTRDTGNFGYLSGWLEWSLPVWSEALQEAGSGAGQGQIQDAGVLTHATHENFINFTSRGRKNVDEISGVEGAISKTGRESPNHQSGC